MAPLSQQIEYLAALAGMGVARSLSARRADRFGAGLGRMAHRLLTFRRRLARDNIKQALGESLSDVQIASLTREVFANLGRTVIELSRYRRLGREGVAALADPAGLEVVRQALNQGRGAILATAHFGNWELLAALIAVNGIPIDAVAFTQHNPKINELVIDLRRFIGISVLEVPANPRQVFRSLEANRLVLMAADQHASAETLIMDFLGRPAAIARGPALFALRCNCPMIPMLLRRERYDRHVLITGETVFPPGSGDEEADVRAMTAAYLRFLEDNIRRWPDQWMWTHNRWKLKPAETIPAGGAPNP